MFGKRILALEVGADSIKVLQCRRKKSYLEVENFKVIPESEIRVEDGLILDLNKAAKIIKTYIKKSKYKTNNLSLVINSSEIITRTIKVEKMDKKDLDIVIKLKYEDYFLFDISNYQLSYKIIKEIGLESEKQLELLIVAAPKKLIKQLVKLADLLKLKIQIISISSDTITYLFKEKLILVNNKSKEDKLMIVEIGSRSIMLTIISEGKGVMSKTVFFTKSEIISKDKLGAEINRFLQFYYSRNKDNTIEKIYITGKGAYMENISNYIENLLGIYCEQGININPVFLEYTSEFESCKSYFGSLLGLVFQVWGQKYDS